MPDIRLTSGNDTYTQPETDKDLWPTVLADSGDDNLRVYSGSVIGGKGNDTITQIYIENQLWRQAMVGYWDGPPR